MFVRVCDKIDHIHNDFLWIQKDERQHICNTTNKQTKNGRPFNELSLEQRSGVTITTHLFDIEPNYERVSVCVCVSSNWLSNFLFALKYWYVQQWGWSLTSIPLIYTYLYGIASYNLWILK